MSSGRRQSGPDLSSSSNPSAAALLSMQAQLDRMAQQQDEMTTHIKSLETEYQTVLGEMVAFQRTLGTQDEVMRNMIQCCMQMQPDDMLAWS